MSRVVQALVLGLGICSFVGCGAEGGDPEGVESDSQAINGGTTLLTGELDAVGVTGRGCTGTLINSETVLTAAHCVCNDVQITNCDTRSTFTFRQVHPVDNPATAADESLSRRDVTVGADVISHPAFGLEGWLTNDFALLKLDKRSFEVVTGVAPMRVAPAAPVAGQTVTIVGRGGMDDATGTCKTPVGIMRKASVVVDSVAQRTPSTLIATFDDLKHVCPGDSGGPMLNAAGQVMGVGSWGGGDSNYSLVKPTLSWVSQNGCASFDVSKPDPDFCADPLCPCANGQGDCDSDSECSANHSMCGTDNGSSVGLPSAFDICIHNPAVCGNGLVEHAEQCDDGNTTSHDGCSSSCRNETCHVIPSKCHQLGIPCQTVCN